MKIKYINHSGFMVECGESVLMIDCCGLTKNSEEVRSCADKNLYILASHVHGDHFDPNILSFGGERTKWILSGDIGKNISHGNDVCFLTKGDIYSDERVRIKAYGSTDAGVSFYIEAGGKRIFHAGDLNNWHWNEEDTPKNAAKSEQWFLEELDIIAKDVPELDAAMFPVDPRLGKDHARGAEQFLDRIKTGLFIPMHFWEDYEAARAFGPAAKKRRAAFADICAAGDVFEI